MNPGHTGGEGERCSGVGGVKRGGKQVQICGYTAQQLLLTPADKVSCQHSSGVTNERKRGLKDAKRKQKTTLWYFRVYFEDTGGLGVGRIKATATMSLFAVCCKVVGGYLRVTTERLIMCY